MNGSPWCEAEKQILKLTAPNLNAAEIGALIGRTRHGVLQQAKNLNIKVGPRRGDKHHSRKYPVEDALLAKQLYEAGMKPRVIAEKLEIDPRSIGNFLY